MSSCHSCSVALPRSSTSYVYIGKKVSEGELQPGDVVTYYYGHVGIVTGVNGDGTIEITDMNGRAGWGRVGVRTVEASEWGYWTFVY